MPIDCSIVVVASRSHRKGPGSIPWGAKCIFLVATELAYKSNAAEGHSLEYLRTFPGMFGNIPQNVLRHSLEYLVRFPSMFYDIPWNIWQHSLECLGTFPGMFGDIPRNVWGHSSECLVTFPRMFGDIPWNVWGHSLECLGTFPGMFGDIPRNVWWHSPEYDIPPHSLRSSHSVPRSCIPIFIHRQNIGYKTQNMFYKGHLIF